MTFLLCYGVLTNKGLLELPTELPAERLYFPASFAVYGNNFYPCKGPHPTLCGHFGHWQNKADRVEHISPLEQTLRH